MLYLYFEHKPFYDFDTLLALIFSFFLNLTVIPIEIIIFICMEMILFYLSLYVKLLNKCNI